MGGTTTRLPIHRLWIIYLGTLGRYGTRKDQGEFRRGR